jgi:uncharacterized protein
MGLSEDKILEEIIERLKREFNLIRVVLFGSRARGTARSDSDYDLVVVVKESSEGWLERCQRASRLLRGSGAAVDVIVVTEAEYKEKVQDAGTIYQIASSEGVEIEFGG